MIERVLLFCFIYKHKCFYNNKLSLYVSLFFCKNKYFFYDRMISIQKKSFYLSCYKRILIFFLFVLIASHRTRYGLGLFSWPLRVQSLSKCLVARRRLYVRVSVSLSLVILFFFRKATNISGKHLYYFFFGGGGGCKILK